MALCVGTEYETRTEETKSKGELHQCTTCFRVFRTKRRHQKPSVRTRSFDNTKAILFAHASQS